MPERYTNGLIDGQARSSGAVNTLGDQFELELPSETLESVAAQLEHPDGHTHWKSIRRPFRAKHLNTDKCG